MNRNYHLGLLYLVNLLISADGIIDEKEVAALRKIKEKEKIPDLVYNEFENNVATKKEREIYRDGIEFINHCNDSEKLRAFVILYKLSEVDGNVHAKEVRLLLYSIQMAGIEFDDLVSEAKKVPSFF
jgi:uncharacterized tellurite resistance protein B-like protein